MSKIELIKTTYRLQPIVEQYTDLKRAGNSFVGKCPIHPEKTPSFHVYPDTEKFCCFGCGAKGDLIDFIQLTNGVEFDEAVSMLTTGINEVVQKKRYAPDVKPVTKYEYLKPPGEAPAHRFDHWELGKPEYVFPYRTTTGEIKGYIIRYANKEIRPLSYAKRSSDGRVGWFNIGMAIPRPLYGLETLGGAETVVIVEGEKTANALRKLIKMPVLCWPFGSNADFAKIDLTPLRGRNVIISPDADKPGFKCAENLYNNLAGIARGVMFLMPMCIFPEGWDWADYIGEAKEAREYMAANIVSYENFKQVGKDLFSDEKPITAIQPLPTHSTRKSFRAMGYSKNAKNNLQYHFYSYRTCQHIVISAPNLTKKEHVFQILEIDQLAQSKPDFDAMIMQIRDECEYAGPFDESRLRGVGAWLDGTDIVIHAGNCLYVNDNIMPLEMYKGSLYYEKCKAYGFTPAAALSTRSVSEMLHLLERCYMSELDRKLLAGWIMLAPICGILPWRPHVWISGPAGTGKTTLLNMIIKPLVGDIMVSVQGVSTEAGIRSKLQNGARPVMFDESDVTNAGFGEAARIDSIVGLARAASSGDAPDIAKGGMNGGAGNSYKINAMFCFSSITTRVTNAADRSRFAIIELSKEHPVLKLPMKFEMQVRQLLTREFCAAFQARTIKIIPQLLAAIETFRAAAANYLGDARAGDQYGTLLAGSWMLENITEPTMRQAMYYTERYLSKMPTQELTLDQEDCLSYILAYTMRIEGKHSTRMASVGELILICDDNDRPGTFPAIDQPHPDDARAYLGRIGIAVKDGLIYIASKCYGIEELLAKTTFATYYSAILRRLPDCQTADKPMYFGPAIGTRRAITLPVTRLRETTEPPGDELEPPF